MDELQKKIVDYVEANGKTYQQIALETVSYTQLTLPTTERVYITVVAV